ncbi:AAA family ATPase [Rhizobium sp. BK619]|uniref:AAA family ATPase n=1 Tax=Rhizobium sp. BK619 TaxID=2586989 RepID=UPI0032B2F2DB
MLVDESGEAVLSDLVLRKITIFEYRGKIDPLVIDLKRDANFLIGRNGTGKTTLINLINNILSARYQALARSPFSAAEVVFAHSDKRYSPTLFVEKLFDEEGFVAGVRFRFRDYKSREDSFSYVLRVRPYRNAEEPNPAVLRKLKHELSKRYSTTWLALNRSAGLNDPEADKPRMPEIDRKVLDTVTRLATYFTKLDNEFAAEVQTFQQKWLLSFLVEERQDNMLRRVNDLDLEEERLHLTSMLQELKIPPEEYLPKVDRHIATAKRLATEGFDKVSTFAAAVNLIEISKLHGWVVRWRVLQEKREQIYYFKNKFLEKLEEMLFRKRAYTDDGNTLRVEFKHGYAIPSDRKEISRSKSHEIQIPDLSSGEKQLIIFLGETLLREKKPYIFIADEPELSLHIEWQEKLVPVILEISPQAQILFATHSPDIVNRYGENVFSMEQLAY